MLQLWIMNDQAAALLPELKRLRSDLATRLEAGKDSSLEEQRVTRALAVVGGLLAQIAKHQAAILLPAPAPAPTARAA